MKKLKRYIIALLIFISCHSIEAGWRDWFSWSSWKQWFSTSRIAKWFYGQSPEQINPVITKTAVTAFQQRQPSAPLQPLSDEEKERRLTQLKEQNRYALEYAETQRQKSPALMQYEQQAELAAADLKKNQPVELPPLPQEVLAWKGRAVVPPLPYAEQYRLFIQALENFLIQAKPFFDDVQSMHFIFHPDFDDFLKKYKNFIDDIDSIQIVKMPRSIANTLAPLNDKKLQDKVTLAFEFLYSTLPWESLTDEKTLKTKEFSKDLINQFAHYLQNYYSDQLGDYAQILLKQLGENTPTAFNRMPLPEYSDMKKVLYFMRKFKIWLDFNALFSNRNRFAQAIQQIDLDLNTSWITRFGSETPKEPKNI